MKTLIISILIGVTLSVCFFVLAVLSDGACHCVKPTIVFFPYAGIALARSWESISLPLSDSRSGARQPTKNLGVRSPLSLSCSGHLSRFDALSSLEYEKANQIPLEERQQFRIAKVAGLTPTFLTQSC